MSFVIWKHIRRVKEAMTHIRFLTDQRFQTTDLRRAGHLPARQHALTSPPFTTDPDYRVIGQSLQTGHSFPPPTCGAWWKIS